MSITIKFGYKALSLGFIRCKPLTSKHLHLCRCEVGHFHVSEFFKRVVGGSNAARNEVFVGRILIGEIAHRLRDGGTFIVSLVDFVQPVEADHRLAALE